MHRLLLEGKSSESLLETVYQILSGLRNKSRKNMKIFATPH